MDEAAAGNPAADTELAWAAGFFDGEGCSYIVRPKRTANTSPYVRVAVSQKGRVTLERFLDAVGEGTIYGPNSAGLFQWVAGGRLQAERVIDRLWPYLSEPKRQQYLSKRAEAGPVGTWGGHHGNAKLTRDQVAAIRERYARGGMTYAALAEDYGIARCTVGQIVRLESWRWESVPVE